jgi:hypothetical protein
MSAKSQQLQIRVTPRQKTALKHLASRAGLDVSGYVLARVLPPGPARFAEILGALEDDNNRRFALAALNDFLHECAPIQFGEAVARASLSNLSSYVQNYVAAMVEQAAHQKEISPPLWVRDIASLPEPHFITSLTGLRLHLLLAAPAPFRRRNIFVDAGVGARV